MEHQVHRRQPRDVWHEFDAMKGLQPQVILLVTVEVVVTGDEFVRGEQEPCRPRCRVDDGFSRPVVNARNDGIDQRPRSEILPGPALGVLGVPLQQPFVSVTLEIGVEAQPVFPVVQVDDQAAELRLVLDPVLGLLDDEAKHAMLVS